MNPLRIITLEMMELFAKHFNIEIEADGQYPGVRSSLIDLCEGRGELPAKLVDAKETREAFKPLRTAYFKSLGQEEPEYSKLSEDGSDET